MIKNILNFKKTFIIAELSANHGQSLEVAKKSIIAIKESGADAVKIQTFKPDTITIDCNNEFFQINHGTIWDGQNLFNLYKKAYTPWEWHEEIFNLANKLNLICFSSPFDFTAVDLLEELNCPIYKIASLEITDIPLIEYVAKKNKPIIISTGIARLDDIDLAIKTIRSTGNNMISILKCTSEYPSPPELANLSTIKDISKKFKCNVGLSDHTIGTEAAIASVALGAKIIEKHFILDKSVKSPDADFSLDKNEFKSMVDSIRNTEKLIGKIDYTLPEKLIKIREKGARSLFVVEDIKKGDIFNKNNIRSIRPGQGMHPKYYNKILGMKSLENIERGTPLQASQIKNFKND